MANHYDATADPARTWLGYVTYTVGGGAANGHIAPIAPATLTGPTGAAVDVVDTTAARGADQLYTLTLPGRHDGRHVQRDGHGPDQGVRRADRHVQVPDPRDTRHQADHDRQSGGRRSTGSPARCAPAARRPTAAVTPFDRTDDAVHPRPVQRERHSARRTARARSRASSRSARPSTASRASRANSRLFGTMSADARPSTRSSRPRSSAPPARDRRQRVPPARPARTRRSASSASPRRRSRPRPRCTCA